MIVAAGLTPAWQQIMRFERLRLGEVNRSAQVDWCASGKALNVAVALGRLAVPSCLVTPLGGATGKLVAQDLTALGIDCRATHVQAATRVCTTLIDEATGVVTELVENAAPMSISEADQVAGSTSQAAGQGKMAILSGSLPEGVRSDFYRLLIERLACPAILDARGPELLAALKAGPLVVKPNRHELERTMGRALGGEAELHAAMCELNAGGARWVVVTEGAKTVWASGDGRLWRAEPPRVESRNPIASGDCLAAVLGWRLSLGEALPEALSWGIAAAAANAAAWLPARIGPEEVARLADAVCVESC